MMIPVSRMLLGLSLATVLSLPAVAGPERMPGGVRAGQSSSAAAVSADGFSMVPPSGWRAGDKEGDTLLEFLGPTESDFTVNLRVDVTDDDGTSLEDFGDAIKAMYAKDKDFASWEAMDEGFTKVSGLRAYYLSGSFGMHGLDIQNLQYFIPDNNGHAYIVTFTALASNYEKFEPIFKAVAASIHIDEDASDDDASDDDSEE